LLPIAAATLGSVCAWIDSCWRSPMDLPMRNPESIPTGRQITASARNNGFQFWRRNWNVSAMIRPKSRYRGNSTGAAFCMVGKYDVVVDHEKQGKADDRDRCQRRHREGMARKERFDEAGKDEDGHQADHHFQAQSCVVPETFAARVGAGEKHAVPQRKTGGTRDDDRRDLERAVHPDRR